MSNTFTRIMVPLDGSEFAAKALPQAMRMMRRTVDTLHLVAVSGPFPILADAEDALVGDAIPGAEDTPEAEYLDQVAARLRAEGVAVTTAVCQGPVARVLADYAEEHEIDLIVMTSHGRGGFSRFWLGSVADELVKRSPVPVMCLRPSTNRPDLPYAETVTRVLVPLDGSPQAEDALEPALALASRLHTGIELLRVVDPSIEVWTGAMEVPITVVPEDLVKRKREAHEYLHEVKVRIQSRAIEVHCAVVTAEHPADAIVSRVREQTGTLVAMVTRRTGLLERAILGSVTDKVLRSAPGPVLICHAAAAMAVEVGA